MARIFIIIIVLAFVLFLQPCICLNPGDLVYDIYPPEETEKFKSLEYRLYVYPKTLQAPTLHVGISDIYLTNIGTVAPTPEEEEPPSGKCFGLLGRYRHGDYEFLGLIKDIVRLSNSDPPSPLLDIYQVTAVEFVPLIDEEFKSLVVPIIRRIRNLERHIVSLGLYFNKGSLDLTTKASFYTTKRPELFISNNHFLKPFYDARIGAGIDKASLGLFIRPCIEGHISYSIVGNLEVWLISKRSTQNVAPVSVFKGVDCDGNVSAYVETELLINDLSSGNFFSFISCRGQVPLLLQQPHSLSPFQTLLIHSDKEKQAVAFNNHFNRFVTDEYVNHTILLLHVTNRISELEGGGQRLHWNETPLSIAYIQMVNLFNSSLGQKYELKWMEWDFDSAYKIEEFKLKSRQFLRPKVAAMGYSKYNWNNQDEITLQNGSFRLSSYDAVDRINFVDSEIFQHACRNILEREGLATSSMLHSDYVKGHFASLAKNCSILLMYSEPLMPLSPSPKFQNLFTHFIRYYNARWIDPARHALMLRYRSPLDVEPERIVPKRPPATTRARASRDFRQTIFSRSFIQKKLAFTPYQIRCLILSASQLLNYLYFCFRFNEKVIYQRYIAPGSVFNKLSRDYSILYWAFLGEMIFAFYYWKGETVEFAPLHPFKTSIGVADADKNYAFEDWIMYSFKPFHTPAKPLPWLVSYVYSVVQILLRVIFSYFYYMGMSWLEILRTYLIPYVTISVQHSLKMKILHLLISFMDFIHRCLLDPFTSLLLTLYILAVYFATNPKDKGRLRYMFTFNNDRTEPPLTNLGCYNFDNKKFPTDCNFSHLKS